MFQHYLTTPATLEPTPEVPDDTNLSDISAKDKPWDEHRASADIIQQYYRGAGQWHGRFLRMWVCAQRLAFAWVWEGEGWKWKIQDARFCRAPGCPVCAWRRSLMWQARFLKALPELEKAHPRARWVFLTLTLKNCPVDELGNTLDLMSQAWHRILKRKEFRSVQGWIRTLEVTKNHTTNYAHPHIHALLMVRPSYFTGPYYVSQSRWADLWREGLRIDYTPVVHIKAIKDKPEALKTAVFEVLKYSLKPSDLADDQDWFLSLMGQLQKRRLISSGGVLKGVLRENEKETDEELALLGEGLGADEERWIPFDWRKAVKRYQRSKKGLQP